MNKFWSFLLMVVSVGNLFAQEVDADLLKIRARLDSVQSFTADMQLDVDVSFINMPTKYAKISYEKGKPMTFESDDFMMVPKRGLDFSMQELFAHPFITVDRGMVEKNGRQLKQINVIPTDKRADFAIATLLMDTQLHRVVTSEVNTKKNGTYTIDMQYGSSNTVLPDVVVVSFEMEKIKLPIQYLSNKMDMEVDKKEMKSETVKTGRILLKLSNYSVNVIR